MSAAGQRRVRVCDDCGFVEVREDAGSCCPDCGAVLASAARAPRLKAANDTGDGRPRQDLGGGGARVRRIGGAE